MNARTVWGKGPACLLGACLCLAILAGCVRGATVEPTVTPALVEVRVYFTDQNRYAKAEMPFEQAVARWAPADEPQPEAVLREFFKGPTQEEQARGLEAITSGFAGFRELTTQYGIARVYLEGDCRSSGATYTIAQPILRNLLQFPEIRYVKLYDASGQTGDPWGDTNSIPACLEP